MSLYSDLNEVLTPYANRIKGLKADLGDLDELETTAKTDLVSAINEAAASGGSGLTVEIKTALMNLVNHLVWDDDDPTGQTYITALQNALYQPIPATAISLSSNSLTINTLNSTQTLTATLTPANSTSSVVWSSSNNAVATVDNGVVTAIGYGTATITATAGNVSATCSVIVAQVNLSSISASYTQSGTVYDNASLDDLKADLVVTASWNNGTTSTLNDADYTLSGTLTAGTSTITVTYGGNTTTFSVTVTANPYLAYWDFTQSLVDTVNGYEFTLSCGSRGTLERTGEGLVFSCPDTGSYDANAQLPNTVTFPKGSKLTIEFGASDAQMTSNAGTKGSTYGFGNGSLLGGVATIYWRGSSEKFYSYESSWSDRWISTAPDYFNNKTLVIEVASDKTRTLTVDGVAFGTVPGSVISSDTYTFLFGRKMSDGQTFHNIKIKKAYVETLSS